MTAAATVLRLIEIALSVLPERARTLVLQFTGYVAVSGTALLVDVAVYATLLRFVEIAALAAAGGYLCGVLTHYALSSRVVFASRLAGRGVAAEAPVLAKFFLAGGSGMLVTVAVVGLLADLLGVHALLAKLVAAGLSFVTVFTVLRVFVFNAAVPPAAPAA